MQGAEMQSAGAGQDYEAIIIGAGPAGLTAAVYLARYRRRVAVIHDGASRAARISLTYNVPGFPEGISGEDLLRKMEEQAKLYGAELLEDRITKTAVEEDGRIRCEAASARRYCGRVLILATGVVLNEVDLDHDVHETCIAEGCLRYCPICDGYEATGRRVAVLGSDVHGAREALFLRQFTDQVTLLPRQWSDLTGEQRDQLAAAGVIVRDQPLDGFQPWGGKMRLKAVGGAMDEFDVVYPALGVTPRSELAEQLGVHLAEGGCIVTDKRQASNVTGVFAAGDVVDGLDQISVAIGQGAIAATRAHNHLREWEGMADLPT